MKKFIATITVLFLFGVVLVSCRGKRETCPAYGKAEISKIKHI